MRICSASSISDHIQRMATALYARKSHSILRSQSFIEIDFDYIIIYYLIFFFAFRFAAFMMLVDWPTLLAHAWSATGARCLSSTCVVQTIITIYAQQFRRRIYVRFLYLSLPLGVHQLQRMAWRVPFGTFSFQCIRIVCVCACLCIDSFCHQISS